jgi:hypothetical protein
MIDRFVLDLLRTRTRVSPQQPRLGTVSYACGISGDLPDGRYARLLLPREHTSCVVTTNGVST